MLTLRRKEGFGILTKESTIDIEYNCEKVTLSLVEVISCEKESVTLWNIYSTDWGSEKYYPKSIALTTNQPLVVNDWLKVYGAKVRDGEGVMHLSAPRNAVINRRDRK